MEKNNPYVKHHLVTDENITFDEVQYTSFEAAVNTLERDYRDNAFPEEPTLNEVSRNLNDVAEVLIEKANAFDMTLEEISLITMSFNIKDESGLGIFEITLNNFSNGLSIRFPINLRLECENLIDFINYVIKRLADFRKVYNFARGEWIL